MTNDRTDTARADLQRQRPKLGLRYGGVAGDQRREAPPGTTK